jgi:hypothetical protein
MHLMFGMRQSNGAYWEYINIEYEAKNYYREKLVIWSKVWNKTKISCSVL